jgi:opacity protein-like surface antigen
MRVLQVSAAVVAIALAGVAASAQDADRSVAGGGIKASGWQGKVDPGASKQGKTINDSKFVQEGNNLRLSIGPAAIYWNPSNTAKGDYTVKATFTEPKMSANHPHPYGVFIGGSNLDSEQQNLMYCVAYGDGTFLVRQFSGTTVNTVAKRQPHEAVRKASGEGSVTNEVGWRVKGGRAECLINGTAVAGFDASEITGAGKLASTDGIVGLRVSHNLDVVVSNFGVNKN